MAPILKEFETPVATATTTSPAAPQAKSPNETPTRPQPVALEIPVTINGARTVEGSDKRAPFSESTQTVLVFPHGAVIRIATPLVPGQLVFLTNEKTKKEVVCQVVKSKASGGAGSYVELQFTEPSLAFWGLQIPGASAAPSVPRPVAPSSPMVNKPAVPAPQVVAKPPVAAKPVAPAPPSTPPAKPVVPPPPPAAIPPAPTHLVRPPVAVAPHAPAQELPKVVPAAEITPKTSSVNESSVAPVPPAITPPASSNAHQAAGPALPLRDYSKQIDALFSVPQAPPTPASEPRVTPAAPTTEDLKVQAARLQEQLSSLLFTEKPSVVAAPSSAPPALYTPENAANELSAKLADIIHAGPAATVPGEPKSVIPIRKPAQGPLGADEEVKIPSWLAPISQNAEVVMESSDSSEASHDHGVSVNSEESYDALAASSSSRPETAVFGGQLLGESSVSATEAATTGSKKGLFLGLAAAGILIIGGGAWYYRQNPSSSATVAATHSGSDKPSSELGPVSNSPAAPVASIPGPSTVNSSTATASRPATANSAPLSPFSAPAVSALPPKNSKPTPKNEEEVVAAPAKPSLGDVHLAAPVVNHNADSQPDGDAFASIDTKSTPSGADPLASAAAHRNGPAAPLLVGGDVKPAQLLKSVAPEYPAIAKVQHVSGRVQIDALIDASGNVTSVKVLSGPALLHRAALDAVKQWKYSPAVLDGQPTVTHVSVNVDFRNQ
jgi:periplasmic protein TonB